jgi:hypothetical protein
MGKEAELLRDFNAYTEILKILESAKLAADDIDTLGDIEVRIQYTKVIQSQTALELLREKGTIQ